MVQSSHDKINDIELLYKAIVHLDWVIVRRIDLKMTDMHVYRKGLIVILVKDSVTILTIVLITYVDK